jgi:hypothetical protein
MKRRLFGSVAALLILVAGIGGAVGFISYESGPKRALREFGWEGVWSQDCSIPNVFTKGITKAVLARSYNSVPLWGPPVRVIQIVYDAQPTKFIFTITDARIVADNKLRTVAVQGSDDVTITSESVLSMVGNKMVALRGHTTGIAKRDIPAGRYSTDTLRAGDTFDYTNAENGVSQDYKGRAIGSAIVEKCRD